MFGTVSIETVSDAGVGVGAKRRIERGVAYVVLFKMKGTVFRELPEMSVSINNKKENREQSNK